MFTVFSSNKIKINKEIQNYYFKTTHDSILKIIKKYNNNTEYIIMENLNYRLTLNSN